LKVLQSHKLQVTEKLITFIRSFPLIFDKQHEGRISLIQDLILEAWAGISGEISTEDKNYIIHEACQG